MSGVAMYQGRALAEISLTGTQLAEALEAFISRRDPSLENVLIRRATPTGDVETRVQPHKRWYEVVFEVDDNPDEDEDDDEPHADEEELDHADAELEIPEHQVVDILSKVSQKSQCFMGEWQSLPVSSRDRYFYPI